MTKCSSCASDSREERASLLLSRLDPRDRGPSVNSIFQRVRDKGRSLPQAPPPAVAGCHPRHFDIDEGNLREHCWRRRLMRRVRARAPRGSWGPVAPIAPPPPTVSSTFFFSLYSSACSMMNCISTPYERPCERLSCETAPSFDVLLPRVKLPTLPRYRDQMTPMSYTSLSFSLYEKIDDASISIF